MSSSVLNILIKLIAVILAVLLWFNVITKKQYEYDLILPVTDIDYPAGLGPVTHLPDSLAVRVAATGRRLLRDDWKEAGLRIKATRLRRGIANLDLNLETVSLARSEEINLLDVPGAGQIAVQLDRIDSVLKPIGSRLAVLPSDGYMIVSGAGGIGPMRTWVIGPALLLNRIDSIYTVQKIIDNVKDSTSLVLDLEIPSGLDVTLGHDSAVVSVNVDRIKTKTLTGVPVGFRGNLRGLRAIVDPERIELEVAGPQGLIDTLTADHIRAMITYDGSLRAGYVVPEIDLPRNVDVTGITPDSVRMLVSP